MQGPKYSHSSQVDEELPDVADDINAGDDDDDVSKDTLIKAPKKAAAKSSTSGKGKGKAKK